MLDMRYGKQRQIMVEHQRLQQPHFHSER